MTWMSTTWHAVKSMPFIDGLVRKCVIRKQPRPLFMLAADANTSMGLSTDGAHWCPDGVRLHPNTLKREAWCELVRQSDTYVIFTSAKTPKHTHTSFSSGQQQQLDHIAIPTSAAAVRCGNRPCPYLASRSLA